MSEPTPAAAPGQDVLITRIFDAPREQVFKAWTDPDEVAAWYGPEHFDTPREKVRIDPRVGGRYELTMVQREGDGEMAIGYEVVEFVEPELIVLRSDPMPEAGMLSGGKATVVATPKGSATFAGARSERSAPGQIFAFSEVA